MNIEATEVASADVTATEPSKHQIDETINTPTQVINYFHEHESEYDKKQHRPLRRAIRKIFRRELTKYFGGKTIDEYVACQVNNRVRSYITQHDKNRIAKTRLRKKRQEKMKEILARNHQLGLLLVPDGPGLTNNTPTPKDDQLTEHVLYKSRRCYICKRMYSQLHHFYDQLCQTCGQLNWTKRKQTANLSGKVALVTGGRMKIGFQTSLKLLRCGASVIVTTRFPIDAADRYAKQSDFDQWKDRLKIFGLDFRDIASVERFCTHLNRTLDRLDIIVNNATQTVRKPISHYRHLADLNPDQCSVFSIEAQTLIDDINNTNGTSTAICTQSSVLGQSAIQSQLCLTEEDATNELQSTDGSMVDVHDRPIDVRTHNSWTLKLDQVPTAEAAEVFAINTLAPFVFNSKLKPLLLRNRVSNTEHKFIVNVSAMEGKFNRFKTACHPHTNMAKAAVNMMTRTSAEDYAKQGIYMTSVDTGWINDEAPLHLAQRRTQTMDFQPPLDEIDAAARILDPVFVGFNEHKLIVGKFLKDYDETEW